MTNRTTLLLNGFMGTGKSTVGKRVAARLGLPFVDLDEAIVARAGKPIPAIFANDGEPAFRRLEREELGRLVDAPAPHVIALGGGALLDRDLRRRLLAQVQVVTLGATPETLAARTAGAGRPLLDSAPDRLERIRQLLEARADAYAEAHARIETDGLSEDAVAEAVVTAAGQSILPVPLGPRTYPVRFVDGDPTAVAAAVAALRPSMLFVLTDETVQRLWGAPLLEALAARGLAPRATVVVPPGEQHKKLATIEQALTTMVEAGADRAAVVLGHGGGVVTDMAGFTAAVLLRGVRWVGAPTTLLSMVDASVGGKTGVDLGPAKNAVGAFHQPSAVVVDVAHTATESDRAFRSGLAEVVKAAAIGDPALFDRLERAGDLRAHHGDHVRAAVAVKTAIVARDERESGDRALLNFGHTLGHALESEGGYARLTHGEAVSLGMVAALRIGAALGVTPPPLAARVTALLAKLGLPTDLDAQPLAAALPLVGLDKKRRGGAIRFVLLRALGDAIVRPLAPDSLSALLTAPPSS
jgi:shikimate kinase/3-dehydroquinate synthase